MSRSTLLKAIVFTYFYISLAFSDQLILHTKASIVCITLIRLSIVIQNPREGSAAFPGCIGGQPFSPAITSYLDNKRPEPGV